MKKIVMFSLAVIFMASSTHAKEAMVLKVIDGDTIQIDDGIQREIDILGIDAPELNQPYGLEAAQRLQSILPSRVYLDRERNVSSGSRAADVIMPNGRNIALDIVGEGMAWCNYRFNRDNPIESFHPVNNEALCQTEKKARKNGNGLWALSNATSPWIWRANNVTEVSLNHSVENVPAENENLEPVVEKNSAEEEDKSGETEIPDGAAKPEEESLPTAITETIKVEEEIKAEEKAKVAEEANVEKEAKVEEEAKAELDANLSKEAETVPTEQISKEQEDSGPAVNNDDSIQGSQDLNSTQRLDEW